MMTAARVMASHLKNVRGRGRRGRGTRGLMAQKPTLHIVDTRRALPSVIKVLAALASAPAPQALPGDPGSALLPLPHGLAVAIARDVVDGARRRVEAGEAVTEADVFAEALRRAAGLGRSLLQPVINATG